MNTPSPDPTQELLTPWLQAYDFAVAEESGESSDPVPADLAAHIEQVKSCLRLLESVWPRSQPRLPTRPDLGGEVTTPGNEVPSTRSGRLLDVPGFDIEREIARGGMGVVYKARQQSLDRVVAIKCLPPVFAQDPNRLARFRREARAAAKLVNKGILPVYDVLEAGGVPLLVMPYIDGSDLARIINDRITVREGKPPKHPHAWAALSDAEYLEHILPVLDKAVEALTLLHRAEVIHRDIKPSNILVDQDGHAWLSDFGLARLGKVPGLTEAGHGLGTPGYMSPEQWQGSEAVDGRTDVFSMGVTIYQALTLALPYGRERLTADTRLPSPPSKCKTRLPADMDAVILRALAPDLRDRYASAAEFQEDWSRVRTGVAPRRRAPRRWPRVLRQRWRTVVGTAILFLGLFTALKLMSGGGPQGQDAVAPVLQTIAISTEPPGADMVFVPLDPTYGEPDPENAVWSEPHANTVKLQLPPGPYFVEAQIPDGRFHQVYRYVPSPSELKANYPRGYVASHPQQWWTPLKDGTLQLATIRIPRRGVTTGMARLDGGDFTLGSMQPGLEPSRPPHHVIIPPYCLDPHEVTEKEYRDVQEEFKQKEKLPSGLSKPRGADFPVTKIEFIDAEAWAERAGKRLPTEAEYEYAATNGGRTLFPWGNDVSPIKDWPLGPVCEPKWDRTGTNPPIFGLYSNVAEWTSTWRMCYPGSPEIETPGIGPRDTRVYRGGPWSIVDDGTFVPADCQRGPRWRAHLQVDRAMRGLGFRCARSVAPVFLPRRPEPR